MGVWVGGEIRLTMCVGRGSETDLGICGGGTLTCLKRLVI